MTAFKLFFPAAGGPGTKIEIDGKPVLNATSIAVKTAIGEVTKVYVEMLGEGTVEGEGIVHVVRDGTADSIAAWLAQIDPDELEKATLERFGLLGDGSVGASMLEVLGRWAGGGS